MCHWEPAPDPAAAASGPAAQASLSGPAPAPSGSAPAAATAAGPPPGPRVAASFAAARVRHLLVLLVTPAGTSEHTVDAGSSLQLGRDPKWSPCHVNLAADDTVSRQHAVLVFSAEHGVVLRACPVTVNSTYVNGRLVDPGTDCPLQDRDSFQLGVETRGQVQVMAGPAGRNQS
jgi:hypothetical protein